MESIIRYQNFDDKHNIIANKFMSVIEKKDIKVHRDSIFIQSHCDLSTKKVCRI